MAGCYTVFHKQLGDLLLLEPALRRLREYHGSPVSLLTRHGHLPLLNLMEGVEFEKGLSLAPRGDLYCFDPLSKSAVRSFFTLAARKRCILPEKREMKWYHPLIFRPIVVPELGDRYVAEYFWANTPGSGSDVFHPPQIRRPPETWRPPDFDLNDFILINPTSGWKKKNWTAARWAEVIKTLHATRGLTGVMTSSATDWQVAHCREIAERAGLAVRSLASGTTLEQFLWLCSRARLILTVDGAASHFGAAFGVKNLTLFGPTSVRNWHFPTEHSVALVAPPAEDGSVHLRELAPELVIESAQDLLRL